MTNQSGSGDRLPLVAGDEESATQRAYSHIRTGILEGRLRTGEMLSEGVLGAELNLSRTPIRAALARLQDEQWITIYPKRGALVRGMSERMVGDLIDARFILEAAAIHRTSPARKAELAERLSGLLDEQEQATADRDLRRLIDLLVAFHRAFVEASGNSVMLELSDRLADRQRHMLFHMGDELVARSERNLTEHRALLEALRIGDDDLFTKTLHTHMDSPPADGYVRVPSPHDTVDRMDASAGLPSGEIPTPVA